MQSTSHNSSQAILSRTKNSRTQTFSSTSTISSTPNLSTNAERVSKNNTFPLPAEIIISNPNPKQAYQRNPYDRKTPIPDHQLPTVLANLQLKPPSSPNNSTTNSTASLEASTEDPLVTQPPQPPTRRSARIQAKKSTQAPPIPPSPAMLPHHDPEVNSLIQSIQDDLEEISQITQLVTQEFETSNSQLSQLNSPTPDHPSSSNSSIAASIPSPASSHTLLSDDNSAQSNTDSININNINVMLQNDDLCDFTDVFSPKHKGHFRFLLQNPNGINVYKEKDPDYLPSILTFKDNEVDAICLPESNVPWHKNDLHYDISKQNQLTWGYLPTKTVTASCRKDTTVSNNYQPGGALTVITSNLTTKIKSTSSDPLGRWTKVVFHAKGGGIALYTVYRPNKNTMKHAGSETAWMQQYRQLEKDDKKTENPRRQLILDLIEDITAGYIQKTWAIVAGDFNEDLSDKENGGLNDLLDACNLTSIFEYKHGYTPSTRHNSRSIDHFFISSQLQQFISKSGTVPLEIGFTTSDHRGLYVDFHPDILDTRNVSIIPPQYRKLRMNNAVKVEWYIHVVLDQARSHNIQGRLDKLSSYIKEHGFDDHAGEQLNAIDKSMTAIMLKAERDITPDSKPYSFSEAIVDQIHSVRIIKTFLKQKQQNKQQIIQERIAYNPNLEDLNKKSIPDLVAILAEARNELRQMQEEAYEYREQHLDNLYEKAAELENKDKMIIIKELKEREKQKRMFQRINFILKSFIPNNVSRLGIPKGMGDCTTQEIWDFIQQTPENDIQWEYTEKEEDIKFRLREWNILHFNQSHDTPLASAEWEAKLTPENQLTEDMTELITTALHTSPDLHPDSRCVLEEILRNIKDPMPPERTTISLEEFRSFYRTTKEDISSSPSGLHLGHYKAASHSAEFSKILWSIAALALDHQFCLKRWTHSATILLEKVAGKPMIHRFRTIHLLESDLNYVMRKIWGRDFMVHNEKLQNFHTNQYGGRKGRQPGSSILNKVLTLDIIRYYGEDMVIIDNDAKACYDRVLPYLTMYMLRRLGMPLFLGRFLCNVLKEMQYTIRTNYGPTEPYSQSDARLFGTGQGAGWSPPCWAANSDIISCAMERHTPGMLLQHPNQLLQSHRHLDAFVDDTSLGLTQTAYQNFDPPPNAPVPKGTSLYHQAQLNTQFYSRLLFTTGGLLAIHKCVAYLLLFTWINGHKRMQKVSDQYAPMRIQQGINLDPDYIRIKDPWEAFRMLGAYVAPDGNVYLQVEILYNKSKKWALKINNSHLSPHEAFTAFELVLMPALVYPIGAIPITEEQCKHILGPALQALLPKLGFNSTLARDLVHAPSRYGGPGLSNLYTYAGNARINMFIGHLRKQDATADILKISLGCCQQELGIGNNFLMKRFSKYGWLLQQCWLKELWIFLDKIGGAIEIMNDWVQENRKNDIFIMHIVHDLQLSPDKIRIFNMCRLHKKVTFISELLNHELHELDHFVFNPDIQHATEERFPKMQIPKPFWAIWNNLVKTIHHSQTIPIQRIGPIMSKQSCQWLSTKDHIYVYAKRGQHYVGYRLQKVEKNKYFYDDKILFQTSFENVDHLDHVSIHKEHNLWVTTHTTVAESTTMNTLQLIRHKLAQKLNHRYSRQSYRSKAISNHRPKYVPSIRLSREGPQGLFQPYDLHKYESYREWWLNNRPFPLPHNNLPTIQRLNYGLIPKGNTNEIHTILHQISDLPPPYQRTIGQIQSIQNLSYLAQAIAEGRAIGVCDASVNSNDDGSQAYIIESTDEKNHITGASPVDCDEDDMESTRSEMTGVLAILLLLQMICDEHSIISGEVTIYCDNNEAINIKQDHPFLLSYVRFCSNNYDLKHEIRHQLSLLPIAISFSHVKGHKDDDKQFEYDLAQQYTKRNIDMDKQAKEFLHSPPTKLRPHRCAPTYPNQIACLQLHDSVVVSNYLHHVKLNHLGPRMESRLHQKQILLHSQQSEVNWRAYERAMNRYRTSSKLPIVKLIHDLWPTSAKLHEWYPEMPATCLRCSVKNETVEHIFQCRSPHATNSHQQAIKTLQATLEKANTSPIIVTSIIGLLHEQRKGYPQKLQQHPYQNPKIITLVKKVSDKQKALGLGALTKGFIVREWEALQNLCDNHATTQAQNTEWASKCINALWTYTKNLWDDRCTLIHSPDPTTKLSLKTREIRKVLRNELEWLQKSKQYDDQQLAQNIQRHIDKALDKTMYKWLNTIRTKKEEESRRKNHDRIPKPRVRPISTYFSRGQRT